MKLIERDIEPEWWPYIKKIFIIQVWKKIICTSFRSNSTLYKCHLSLIVFNLRFNILKILDKTLLSLFYALLFQKKNYFMLFSNARHGYTEYLYISLLTKKTKILKDSADRKHFLLLCRLSFPSTYKKLGAIFGKFSTNLLY